MDDKKYDFEVKVGMFVFIALVLLVIIIFNIGDFNLFQPGYKIITRFHYTSGLEVGAPVRLAGVKIGEVKEIKIFSCKDSKETFVDVESWIKKDVLIKDNSVFEINMLGLLGEKYMEILPGDSGGFLKKGSIIKGKDPIPMWQITNKGYKVFSELEKTIKNLNEVFTEENILSSFKKTAENSEDFSKNLVNISNLLQEILKSVKSKDGTFGKLLLDDELYRKIDNAVEDIKQHPWKLLHKPENKDDDVKTGNRGYVN